VIFGEPISVYTDAQAVEDGFVVDLDSSRTYGFWGFPSIG
jgi:type I site-specific restriction endonuclease